MKGFDDKALVLLPHYDVYFEASRAYRDKVNLITNKLLAYLKTVDIEPHCFVSNETAIDACLYSVKWINTMSRGDLHFMTTQNDLMAKLKLVEVQELDSNVLSLLNSKYRIEKGISEDERFNLIVARDKLAIKELLKDYKCIINIQQKNKMFIRVPIKNDQKLIIDVNTSSMIAKSFISGIEIPIDDALQKPDAVRAINLWEV